MPVTLWGGRVDQNAWCRYLPPDGASRSAFVMPVKARILRGIWGAARSPMSASSRDLWPFTKPIYCPK